MHKLSLFWRKYWFATTFVLAFSLGGVFLLFAPLRMKSTCPPEQPAAWHIQGYEYPASNKRDPKRSEYVAEKKNDSDKHNNGSGDTYGKLLVSWLCNEAKATDLLLVFFTYCLVVVGGFAMWSLDRTAKRTERAYIVCGGPFGKRKRKRKFHGFFPEKNDFFQIASNFSDPWRMAIHNYGKTPGFVTGIKWGLCPNSAFKRDILVSEIVANPQTHLPKDRVFESPSDVDESIPPTIDGIPYRYVTFDRNKYIGWVFFGRVDYKDVFGDSHHSTFKVLLTEEHSDSLQGSHSDDWS